MIYFVIGTLIWFLCGAIAAAWLFLSEHYKKRQDVTVGHVFIYLVIIMSGAVTFCFIVPELVSALFMNDKVLIKFGKDKGKKKDE